MTFNHWKKFKVMDIGKVITGKTPSTKIIEYWGGNIPFLTPSDDMVQKNITRTIRYLSKKAADDFKNLYLPIDTISVSCIGSDLGKVVKVKKPLITNQQINSIIPYKSFDPDFIYYSMVLLGKKLNYLSKTSTAIPIINKKNFSNFEVAIPSLKIQKSIANTLSSIDNKIELNIKINKKLEELAQTLYKRWFVDFEFPNDQGKPYKSSGGEMVDSELGLIPKGWEILNVDKILVFERGIEPGSKNYSSANKEYFIPFFRVGDLDSRSNVYVDKSLTKGKIVNEKDILVSFDGAIGRVGTGFEGSYSTGLRKVYEKNGKLKTSLIYFIMKSDSIQNTIKQHSNGTTILHASTSIPFLKLAFNYEVYKKFELFIDPIFDEIITIKKQSKNLENLRDLLLPNLMSGEIEVPDME